MKPQTAIQITRRLLSVLPATLPHALTAQGCAQCADQLRSTPLRAQNAYRHAILFMIAAATGVFTAALLIVRRTR